MTVTECPGPCSAHSRCLQATSSRAAGPGMAAGVVWQLGNACCIAAVTNPHVGLAVAMPIMQVGRLMGACSKSTAGSCFVDSSTAGSRCDTLADQLPMSSLLPSLDSHHPSPPRSAACLWRASGASPCSEKSPAGVHWPLIGCLAACWWRGRACWRRQRAADGGQ